MKLWDANLQFYEKNSFTHPPSCILPLFSQNASRLLLRKRLCKRPSTLSFRKYKRKVCYFSFTCSITIHVSQLSSCWMWHLTFSWDYKTSFFFAVFSYVPFYKNLIVLHHGDDNVLYSILTSVSNSHFHHNLSDEKL